MIAGCAKDEAPQGNADGVLTVSIKSEKSTRAVSDATNTAAVVDAFEKNVYGFSAYVFGWDTGDLEASGTSADGTPITITGLNTAGAKRIVVIANGDRANYPNSDIPLFANNSNYSRIESGYVSLTDQTFSSFTDLTKGFLMTGENATPKTLSAGANSETITVKRVVAKVQLGTVTFGDGVDISDIANFNITGIAPQRAAVYSRLSTGAITTAPTSPAQSWVGGFTGGSVSAVNAALADVVDLRTDYINGIFTAFGYTGYDDATIPAAKSYGSEKTDKTVTPAAYTGKNFFYILPNSDVDKYTLLTLQGTYNGTQFFYPIEINDPDVISNDDSADGQYVKRNTIYTINLTFTKFTGETDPDLPGVAADLAVTVDVADWEGPVTQDSTW